MANIPHCMSNIIMKLDVLQLKIKKCLVYGEIVFIWIFVLASLLVMNSTTDIINGTCVVSVYSSYAQEIALNVFTMFFTYIVPIALCAFCYCRIVLKLKYKVTDLVQYNLVQSANNYFKQIKHTFFCREVNSVNLSTIIPTPRSRKLLHKVCQCKYLTIKRSLIRAYMYDSCYIVFLLYAFFPIVYFVLPVFGWSVKIDIHCISFR